MMYGMWDELFERMAAKEAAARGAPRAANYVATAPGAPMTEAQAQETVRKIYLEVLNREPDYPGALGYLNGLIEGRFGPSYIREELTRSTEYAVKHPALGPAPPAPDWLGWLQENWILVAAGVGALVLLPALLGSRKR